MNGKTQASPSVVKHDVGGDAVVVGEVVVSTVVVGEVVVVSEDAVVVVVDETSMPSNGQFSKQKPHLPE